MTDAEEFLGMAARGRLASMLRRVTAQNLESEVAAMASWIGNPPMAEQLEGAMYLATRLLASPTDASTDSEAEGIVDSWLAAGRERWLRSLPAGTVIAALPDGSAVACGSEAEAVEVLETSTHASP